MGRSRSADRRRVQWCLGASGDRGRSCSDGGIDLPRRICGLGGRQNPGGAGRRANQVVRTDALTRWFGAPPFRGCQMLLLSDKVRLGQPCSKVGIDVAGLGEPECVKVIARRKSLNFAKSRMLETAGE